MNIAAGDASGANLDKAAEVVWEIASTAGVEVAAGRVDVSKRGRDLLVMADANFDADSK